MLMPNRAVERVRDSMRAYHIRRYYKSLKKRQYKSVYVTMIEAQRKGM